MRVASTGDINYCLTVWFRYEDTSFGKEEQKAKQAAEK